MGVYLHQEIPDFEEPRKRDVYGGELQIIYDRETGVRWVVDGKVAHGFTGYMAYRRASACATLLHRGGSMEVVKDDHVPVSVARLGKAAIATYLFCTGWGKDEVAEMMEIEPSTVSQYVSDFDRHRR